MATQQRSTTFAQESTRPITHEFTRTTSRLKTFLGNFKNGSGIKNSNNLDIEVRLVFDLRLIPRNIRQFVRQQLNIVRYARGFVSSVPIRMRSSDAKSGTSALRSDVGNLEGKRQRQLPDASIHGSATDQTKCR
jgi:hypothetical protein